MPLLLFQELQPGGNTGEGRRGHLGNSTVLSSNVRWPLFPAKDLLVMPFALDCSWIRVKYGL